MIFVTESCSGYVYHGLAFTSDASVLSAINVHKRNKHCIVLESLYDIFTELQAVSGFRLLISGFQKRLCAWKKAKRRDDVVVIPSRGAQVCLCHSCGLYKTVLRQVTFDSCLTNYFTDQ